MSLTTAPAGPFIPAVRLFARRGPGFKRMLKEARKRSRFGAIYKPLGTANAGPAVNPRGTRKRLANISNHIHYFQRSHDEVIVSAGASNPVTLGWSFQLDSYPNYTEFENLFDEYKIVNINVEFCPYMQAPTTAEIIVPNAFNVVCMAHVDHNDSTAPANQDEMFEHGGALIKWMMCSKKQFDFKPHVLSRTYVSAIADGYSSLPPQWIPTTNHDVKHYGLKFYAFVSGFANQAPLMNMITTLTIACRNVK